MGRKTPPADPLQEPSFFGSAGTDFGAAIGSVAGTLTTVLYQRSLDRTREKLVGHCDPDAHPVT